MLRVVPEPQRVVLKLYVAGGTARSERAVRRLREIVEGRSDCDLDVVDILRHPQAAEDARILATPALVKESPPPVRRVVGDLSDTETLVLLLDLPDPQPEPK